MTITIPLFQARFTSDIEAETTADLYSCCQKFFSTVYSLGKPARQRDSLARRVAGKELLVSEPAWLKQSWQEDECGAGWGRRAERDPVTQGLSRRQVVWLDFSFWKTDFDCHLENRLKRGRQAVLRVNNGIHSGLSREKKKKKYIYIYIYIFF